MHNRPHSQETKDIIAAKLRAKTLPLRDRFLARVPPRPEAGCWLWGGMVGLNGYGIVSNGITAPGKPRQLYAHRVSYELFVGPIPDGLTIDHLCRTPLCVNPEHLEPVTLAENSRRAARRKEICPRGHVKDGVKVNGRTGRVIPYCLECNRANARKYGNRARKLRNAAKRLAAAEVTR